MSHDLSLKLIPVASNGSTVAFADVPRGEVLDELCATLRQADVPFTEGAERPTPDEPKPTKKARAKKATKKTEPAPAQVEAAPVMSDADRAAFVRELDASEPRIHPSVPDYLRDLAERAAEASDGARPRHIVCFSGGHSSALVAIEVVRRYGKNGVVLLNHDINPRVEDTDVKRFKQEVADYLGLPITYANHAKWEAWDQFDVVMDARAFKVGNGHEICTSRLKTEPFMRWLKASACPDEAVIYYGFDASETDRIQRRSTILGAEGWRTDYPLAFWPRTIESTHEIGVEPPLTYSTWKHANCVGCLKAKRQHWYVVFCTRPDIWQRAKDAEENIGYTIISGISLEELEPLFVKMRAAGIVPTEHVEQQRFWADARKAVRSLPLFDDTRETRPCECVV